MPCWHINEKTSLLASVDTQKSLELEGEQPANTGLHLAQVEEAFQWALSITFYYSNFFHVLWVEWETINTNVR